MPGSGVRVWQMARWAVSPGTIGAGTSDQEIYPEDNVITTKTIEGDAGRYGVHLFASAPAPVLMVIV